MHCCGLAPVVGAYEDVKLASRGRRTREECRALCHFPPDARRAKRWRNQAKFGCEALYSMGRVRLCSKASLTWLRCARERSIFNDSAPFSRRLRISLARAFSLRIL